jgi:hypothetical protein
VAAAGRGGGARLKMFIVQFSMFSVHWIDPLNIEH